jgi:lysophospholipase L1-like esterase
MKIIGRRPILSLLAFVVVSAVGFSQVQPTPSSQPAQAPPGLPVGGRVLSPEEQAARQKAHEEQLATDWPSLGRYREADTAQAGRVTVVFMGDSITEFWGRDPAGFFPGKPYANRGISGQTTPQMLLRFRQDVVGLKPQVVVINGGTNDIAGNTGPSTLGMIEDNLASMLEIAKANNIKVVLTSVTPAYDYPWKGGMEPAEKIVALNDWMSRFCAQANCFYADYFSAMSDEKHGMKPGLSRDGVHPTPDGYAVMAPIAEKAIAEALRR